MTENKIRDKLINYKDKTGKNNPQLAVELGTTPQTVGRWINGMGIDKKHWPKINAVCTETVKKKYYSYACDSVETKRKGVQEIWHPINELPNMMFWGYPYFNKPPMEPESLKLIRYGYFVIDIDTEEIACEDTIKILVWFHLMFGVMPEQWRIYLSGKKGVHLELSSNILGTSEGSTFLPLAYKKLAQWLESELKITLDTSMYNMGTGKPYRRPNVMRQETGTCKRQIIYEKLQDIKTPEQYIASCSAPGSTWEPDNTEPNTALAELMQGYLVESEASWMSATNRPDVDISGLLGETPPCMEVLRNLRERPPSGALFNKIAMQLTAYAISTGVTVDEFIALAKVFIENYPTTSLGSIKARRHNCIERFKNMTRDGYKFSCGGVKTLRISGYECSGCKLHDPLYGIDVSGFGNQPLPEGASLTPLTPVIQPDQPVTPVISILEKYEVKIEYVNGLGKEEFLYPNLIIKQQILVIIAESGGGKTTFLFFHVAAKLADNGLTVCYVDADSPASDHKRMKTFADKHGIKFMIPDVNQGTTVESLLLDITALAAAQTDLSNYVFIFDTLKKFMDLMSKANAKQFFVLMRRLTKLGATVILPGHANKHRDSDGLLVFEGVGDVKSDSDNLIFFEKEKNNDGSLDVTTVVDIDKGAKVRGIFKPFSFNISESREITFHESALKPVDRSNTGATRATEEDILKVAVEYLKECNDPVKQKQLIEYTKAKVEGTAGRDKVQKIIIQRSVKKGDVTPHGTRFVYTIGDHNAHYYESLEEWVSAAPPIYSTGSVS